MQNRGTAESDIYVTTEVILIYFTVRSKDLLVEKKGRSKMNMLIITVIKKGP